MAPHLLHPKDIQVRLGHCSITETMDTYGHPFPDSGDGGRGAIDAAFHGPDPAQSPDKGTQNTHQRRSQRVGRTSRPVSRVLSLARTRTGDHPSGTAVAGGLVRSTCRLGRAALERLHSDDASAATS